MVSKRWQNFHFWVKYPFKLKVIFFTPLLKKTLKIDIKIKYFHKTDQAKFPQSRSRRFTEVSIYSTCSLKQITAGEYLCEADKLQKCLPSWSHRHPFHSLCLFQCLQISPRWSLCYRAIFGNIVFLIQRFLWR